ncbi:MAG: M48 family metallopeptidase [Candidatus Omnitrophica bacterium]|nr:M48 family metallopeptidase [Candidatus Omnitrophota bacterium]
MPETADRAKQYARIKRRFFLADLLLTTVLFSGLLLSGAASFARDIVIRIIPQGWPFQVAVYACFLGAVMTFFSFPLDFVRSFAIEHRFGLSTQTLPKWLLDYFKKITLGGVIGLALIEALSATFRISPSHWWMWAAVLSMGWAVFMTRVLPTWLIPIFYRQRPLPDEGLKNRLASLVASCGTRINGIYEINLSTTTRKSNACLCGIGKTRRVLISDTLLSSYPPEEIESVLAHEVGHHRLHHIGILLWGGTAQAAVGFFAVDRCSRLFFEPLGISGLTDLAALPLIGFGLFIANILLMPAINGLSRVLEAQADRFALQKTGNPQAFIGAMRRLAEQNLSEISPPKWVEWLLYDHPPIAKRIASAQASPTRS